MNTARAFYIVQTHQFHIKVLALLMSVLKPRTALFFFHKTNNHVYLLLEMFLL